MFFTFVETPTSFFYCGRYLKTNINEGECGRIVVSLTNNKQTDSRFTFKTGIKQFNWRYTLTVIVLVLSIEKSKVLSFSDYTAVFSTGCSWDEVFEQIWSDLSKLKLWFDTHYTVTLQTC